MTEKIKMYKIVSLEIWKGMLKAARNFDIQNGGFFDARSGCVNVWASPNDKPPSWSDVVITKGELNYPRSYVGGVYAKINDDFVELEISVTPYSRWDHEKRVSRLDRTPNIDEFEWVASKVDNLIEISESENKIISSEGILCRFCDKLIKVSLLNEFIYHLVNEHDVKIYSVLLGSDCITMTTNIGEIRV